MAGFFAAKFGIFREVETEPDPNAQQPQVQEQQPAQEPEQQQQDQQGLEQPAENPEQNSNQQDQGEQSQNGGDTLQDINPAEDPSTEPDPGQDPQTSDQNQPEEKVDEIKEKEEEIYSNLTPEQLDIKHKELKSQFLAMFDMTTEIVQRINNIALDAKDVPVVEYVSNNLSKLRKMITDYMQSVYKTKSYTENYINYNRFLATLNGISKILEEINKNED